MADPIPKTSWFDSLTFNLCHVAPYFLAGIFAANRRWVGWLTFLGWHPFSVRLGNYLKKKYRSQYVYINMAGRRSLVLLGVEGVAHVLDRSPDIYADNQLKRRGMSHWQPNSATISRGEEWRLRREFNEQVLASHQRVHPDAAYFLTAARAIVSEVQPRVWDEFNHLFDCLMLQVTFGESEGTAELSAMLTSLRHEANRIVGLRQTKLYAQFAAALARQLEAPGEHGLVPRFGDHNIPEQLRATIRPENQIPHWMFAIKETIAANAVRALALIVSHPVEESRVRDEMALADLTTPKGIDSLAHLEGCIQEGMRLWPTTPLLIRELIKPDTLHGEVVPVGTQVLIFNNFHHRDTDTYPDADRFRPEMWAGSPTLYQFNHFSNGRQVCAGKNLALFLAKAVLATLLDGHRYCLVRPTLQPDQPLPQMYNYFKIQFDRVAI